MIDTDSHPYYTESDLLRIAEETATQTAKKTLAMILGGMNLENFTKVSANMPEGNENGMAKQIKERVEIGRDAQGKPIYKWATGYNRQEVLQSAARLIAENGIMQAQPTPKQQTPLFKPYAENWMRLYKAECIRHTTCSEYGSLLKKHLIPAFGAMRIADITPDTIQAFMNERKDYAHKSIHEMKMVLGMILDGAVEDGYIARNPAKSKRLKNPSKKKNARRALTEEQARDIISHIPALQQHRDRRYIALLLYTGMRREEVLGLRWIDLDTENMRIYIHSTITFKGNAAVEGPTKTEAGRRLVPIHPELLPWLTHEDNNREFVVQDGITQQTVKCMWNRIKSKINVYGITPHCFRHTFATVNHRNGMDDKTLQAIGGWADIETMRDVYTHTQDADVCRAAKMMNNMFSAASCDNPCDTSTNPQTLVS